MAKDDWYRNKQWNEQIERDFSQRLRRARSQRDQYLAIQALTLAGYEPQVALKLVDEYFGTRRNTFHDIQALLARAHAHRAVHETEKAIQDYKAILALEDAAPNHKTTTYVDFPYFVALEMITAEFGFAQRVLEIRKGDLMFPLERFMWHASYAIIEAHRGNRQLASRHASEALSAAEVEKSGFRYHYSVGLVGDEHQPVIEKLDQLAHPTSLTLRGI